MSFKVSGAVKAGGTFTFTRGEASLKIHHRALNSVTDYAVANDRAFRTAIAMREGMAEGAALGFEMPDGFEAGAWSPDDWQTFAVVLVQAELLALIATGFDGLVLEDGSPLPFSRDAVRTLVFRNPDLYQAWMRYAAVLDAGASEGNVFALSPTMCSAGALPTATDAVH